MKNLIPTFEQHLNESLNEARKLYPEDCVEGKLYEIGYRSHKWESKFMGWKLEKEPIMLWVDWEDGHVKPRGDWYAYLSEGVFSIGSSADKLIIYKEIK